jgi:hypothetical protein
MSDFNRVSFSACWSDRLGAEINKRCANDGAYPIACWPGSDDFAAFQKAVMVGIDSCLEAIEFEQGTDRRGAPKFSLAPASVAVLVRRLLNGDGIAADADNEWDAAYRLADGICETLDIELI